ncbi:IQ calmodulin binding motif-containing protein [Phytophthora infestans]|uniref:IQ calmodulin-binding motif-containing protein n=1 Tax=Phytophthora infestans TaxID=4787 RepID=A0A833TQG1_PHYIN|nr:IQ calmodulin binding motif-containing protein [Phytophthora infestans]KAF4139465.1 IQ calmodulin-binding motif-containing protein [Phytophthora infestans]
MPRPLLPDNVISPPTNTQLSKDPTCSSIFYDDLLTSMTPYLTCQRCNSVAFVDLKRVRRKADQLTTSKAGDRKDTTFLYEQVPKCPVCGSTRYLRAGVVSFQEQIEEERNAIKEFERRRVPATALLQRIARGFLGRLEFRRRLVERERYLRKIKRAATKIQTRVRGMQARRRTVIERCLRIIRFMAPQILSYALAARQNVPLVFWYSNAAELSVFYWNYREYVRRSGGKPSLIKVENNVVEITRRVLRREYALVSRIQAQWRGLATRMVFRDFKRQKGWLKGIQQSPAVKIQRLVRGVASRRRCQALQVTTKYPAQREAYRKEMTARAQQSKALVFRQRLMAKYQQQFQINRTTRMIVQTVKKPLTAKKYGSHSTDEEHGKDLGPKASSHVQHSLKNSGNSIMNNDKSMAKACGGVLLPRNPNAIRFAQIRRQFEGKNGKLRGPKLHILKAQMYAPSTSSNSEVSVDESRC